MPSTYVLASAFLALALGACAGSAASHTSTTPGYLGGRAGQPGGWATPAQSVSPNERSPEPAYSGGSSYLSGRMAEPDSWLPPDDSPLTPPESVRAYAYQGGRAGQPWSGPQTH